MRVFLLTALLTEFTDFLSDLAVMADHFQIFGDFNIHMDKSTDPLQKAFGAIIDWVFSNLSPDLLIATVTLWT
jgi:hypothetical protein